MFLVVSDIEAARSELIAHGVDVTGVFHFDGDHQPVPGPDPGGNSYFSYASFADPDGNRWVLQEVKTRLPGRGLSWDLATLTELLREAEMRHEGALERLPIDGPHHLHEAAGAEILDRLRPHDVSPSALVRALPQDCRELLVDGALAARAA